MYSATEEAQETEREISEFDPSPSDPVVRALLTTVTIHSFDLFLISSHATRRHRKRDLIYKERHCMRSTCHWNGHCICMPHPVVVNGKPWSPFCSISFNKPSTSGATSHTEKFSAFSTNFHSWRSKLSYTWQQHTHFKPCINILQLLLWKKSCTTEKNPLTEILVHVLFSVFEMLSRLHKI